MACDVFGVHATPGEDRHLGRFKTGGDVHCPPTHMSCCDEQQQRSVSFLLDTNKIASPDSAAFHGRIELGLVTVKAGVAVPLANMPSVVLG